MSDIRCGQIITNVPNLPGRWSVWSKASAADYGSSSFFVLPVDGHSGGGYAVIRATQGPHDPHPKLEQLQDAGAAVVPLVARQRR